MKEEKHSKLHLALISMSVAISILVDVMIRFFYNGFILKEDTYRLLAVIFFLILAYYSYKLYKKSINKLK